MHALAHMICQPTDGQDIDGTIQGKCILRREAFSGNDFILDGVESRVVGLE
jgi:hypothetical protein